MQCPYYGRPVGSLCLCGCGGIAPIVSTGWDLRANGYKDGDAKRYISGHHAAQKAIFPGLKFQHGYKFKRVLRPDGSKKYIQEHILVAEKALGRPLPVGSPVHHVNENKLDNSNSNLVICEDNAYHSLLHRRMKALRECGHADWLRCIHCGKHDQPSNVRIYRLKATHLKAYHPECARVSKNQQRARARHK